jgi:hypothetical protein
MRRSFAFGYSFVRSNGLLNVNTFAWSVDMKKKRINAFQCVGRFLRIFELQMIHDTVLCQIHCASLMIVKLVPNLHGDG